MENLLGKNVSKCSFREGHNNIGLRHKAGLFWSQLCEVGLRETKINDENPLYWSYSIEFTKGSCVWQVFLALDLRTFKWQWMGFGWINLWFSWIVGTIKAPLYDEQWSIVIKSLSWCQMTWVQILACCLPCDLDKLLNPLWVSNKS